MPPGVEWQGSMTCKVIMYAYVRPWQSKQCWSATVLGKLTWERCVLYRVAVSLVVGASYILYVMSLGWTTFKTCISQLGLDLGMSEEGQDE